ncbi:unnamed protein product [Arabidopsis thaliana]|uniref:Uncharacterized protein n=1 Tax=Arabidopsis thaliana TaxID=3702 RepID=A0A5S9RXF9_ARATH|nr:unnamed protein product [Arabidopsis thaliana]
MEKGYYAISGAIEGLVSDIDTTNDPTVRPPDFSPDNFSGDFFRRSVLFAFFRVFSAVLGQKMRNRRGEWAGLALGCH